MTAAEATRELLEYDPATGAWTWKYRPSGPANWNARFAGKAAGRQQERGYVVIRLKGELLYAHRLAWLFVYGRWPDGEVDHANGDPSDNRLANLRECCRRENAANTRPRNQSGLKGVRLRPSGRWEAVICLNGKQHFLGTFSDQQDAHAAYSAAAFEHYGVFARPK